MKSISEPMLKRYSLFTTLLLLPVFIMSQGVLIQESIDKDAKELNPSAILEVRSTEKGMLIPGMTTIERELIASPANGLLVFDTNENCFYFWDSTAKEGLGGWIKKMSGDVVVSTGEAGRVAYFQDVNTLSPSSFIEVADPATKLEEDPIFLVRNKEGQIVFAVYESGVKVWVDDRPEKSARGTFAVGGFTTQKEKTIHDYLRISPDSVRFNILDSGAKSARGTFAVGGFTTQKSFQDFLEITPESTRIFIDDRPEKSARGTFAVGGFTTQKDGTARNFLNVDTDVTVTNPLGEARILWYPLKEAFLAGNVLIESSDSVGTNSWASGYQSKSVGDWSQALGYMAVARGNYSTAIGNNAIANGESSFAFGVNSIAGQKTGVADNSYAFGFMAKATGNGAFAFGTGTEASGEGSFALGFIGQDSAGVATGHTLASAEWAVAMGMGAQATAQGAFAFGTKAIADNKYAFALGYKTKASQYYATALGGFSEALALGATAMGYYSSANGLSSTAMGHNTTASGNYSTATGNNSIAGGWYSVAMGRSSEAAGDNAVALGWNAAAQGNSSFAAGRDVTAAGSNNVAIGYNSNASGFSSVAIGDGVNSSGAWGSVAIGNQATATHQYATAIGYQSSATQNNSTALGYQAKAQGTGSFAAGYNTTASGLYATVLGFETLASGNYSTAIGQNTTASGRFSTAIGAYSSALSGYETVIGRYNTTYSPSSSLAWNLNDRLFVVANGTGTTTRSNALTILKNGNVGIGVDNPVNKFEVSENRASEYAARFINQGDNYDRYGIRIDAGADDHAGDHWFIRCFTGAGNHTGSIKSNNGTMSFVNTSDKRLKKSISDADFNALNILQNLRVVKYKFIEPSFSDEFITGYIAQEAEKILPQMVSVDPDSGFLGVSTVYLIPVLHRAIQEQQEYIESLEERIERLEKLVENIKND